VVRIRLFHSAEVYENFLFPTPACIPKRENGAAVITSSSARGRVPASESRSIQSPCWVDYDTCFWPHSVDTVVVEVMQDCLPPIFSRGAQFKNSSTSVISARGGVSSYICGSLKIAGLVEDKVATFV
jgi:hypothetical protein